MLKLTKTGIGLLTKQYRSVLKKCLLLNLGLLFFYPMYAFSIVGESYVSLDNGSGGYVTITTSPAYIYLLDQSGTSSIMQSNDAGSYISLSGITGETTYLSDSVFRINGSSYATGIDFATNVTAGTTNASHLATTGAVNQLLNYYYTFRDDKTAEDIEFAEENDSLSLMEVCHA